jgi:hypothetical protein
MLRCCFCPSGYTLLLGLGFAIAVIGHRGPFFVGHLVILSRWKFYMEIFWGAGKVYQRRIKQFVAVEIVTAQ